MASEYKHFADIVFSMNLSHFFQNRFLPLVSHGLDYVLPRACCLCEELGGAICSHCSETIKKPYSLRCHGCGLRNACDCYTELWAIDRTIALTTYTPPFDRLIADMKFQSKQSIAKILGELMGQQLSAIIDHEHIDLGQFCLIPVPLSPARFRQRGFNQALSMARSVRKQAGVPIQTIVQRTAAKQSQSLLNRSERLANLKDTYILNLDKNQQKAIHCAILVDDVMTTGATLNTCAALLKQSGFNQVWALVAARAELH
jgi:ComF family protein